MLRFWNQRFHFGRKCGILYSMRYIERQVPEENAGGSYFLFGPRGTGKSLWLKHRYPQAVFIDLLMPDTRRQLEARPERLREIVEGAGKNRIFIIDEIQKVPEILSLVHLLLEENKQRQFILTGSSSRKLKREGVDLLAGRATLRSFHPFLLSELGDEYPAEEALQTGLIPLVIDSPRPGEVLRSYIDLYLKEEIQQEGLVRNIGAFSRVLETLSFSHASVLNQSEVAREAEVERKTVSGYIEIIEQMMLSRRLPVFSKRAKRQLIKHEKFYFFDAGVFRELRPKGPLDRTAEIDGLALEGLVMQHLHAWADYSRRDCRIYYWRTKSGTEVDFVLYGQNTFAAIEVKNSRQVHSKGLKGLKAFTEDYPEAQPLLLYRGKETLKIDGIMCIPWQSFLENLRAGSPLYTE